MREQFRVEAEALMADGMDFPDRIADEHRGDSPEFLLAWFARSRSELLDGFAGEDPAPAAVVRSDYERRLVGDRPDDGDLGPRSGRLRHAGAWFTRPHAVCAASPTWVWPPSRSATPTTGCRFPTSRSGSSWTRPTASWTGTR